MINKVSFYPHSLILDALGTCISIWYIIHEMSSLDSNDGLSMATLNTSDIQKYTSYIHRSLFLPFWIGFVWLTRENLQKMIL